MNKEQYRLSLPSIKAVFEANKNRTLGEKISLAAVASNVPLIIVCFFYKELYGDSEELKNLAERIIKFYRYDMSYENG